MAKRLPRLGTRVRAKLSGWDEVQANNRLQFPDPGLPTYEGMPEFVEGDLSVRHVHAPWGKFAVYSVTTEDGDRYDIDEKTIELVSTVSTRKSLANIRVRGRHSTS
jgi:hypothetical protein